MSTKYEISIGNADVAAVTRTASAFFKGASIQAAVGLWQGDTEASVILSVVGDRLEGIVYAFARQCAAQYDQDAVLVVSYPVTALLVDATNPARTL